MTESETLEAELHRMRGELAQARAALSVDSAAWSAWDAFSADSPVGISVFDRDLRYIKSSASVAKRLGIAETDLIGRLIYDVMPFARELSPIHQRCLSGEACSLENWVVQTPNGLAQMRLDLGPWFEADGTVGGMVVASYNIIDIVRARDALRRSEQRLTLALQISQSMVWEMTFRDRKLFTTGAVSAIFDEEPAPTTFTEDMFAAIDPQDRPGIEAAWKDHLDSGRPMRTQLRIRRRDGTEVWVDAVAETLRDETGAPERMVGVLRNITQHKHGELAIAHAREAAEAANRAKSEFLANMSHEIRTPLNGVMGVVGALARTPLESQQREMVELIEGSAQALERLLSDILDLSRIESGRFEIKHEPFDLGQILRGVCALFEPRARDKGVAFTLEVAPGCDGRFVGDSLRLRQILSNLFSNAIKFTEQGQVCLRAEPAAGGVRFCVEDTGIGFGADVGRRLFERFEQADGSITRRYGGSGLGLAISRSLAEHMGGVLEARSEPGRGSVFTLTLPLEPLGAPTAGTGTESSREIGWTATDLAGPRAPRVLLAEDHSTNRRVVELILGAAGVELTSVVNGAEAVEAAASQSFDLILMDMQMPVMDGLTAIRAIRAKERADGTTPMPILALTANAMPEHIRASYDAGAGGHITKPFAAQVLLEAVAEACAPSRDRMLSAAS